jgi:signal peptidase II
VRPRRGGVWREVEMFHGMLITAGVFLFLDQFTKWLVTHQLAEGQSVFVAPWVRIRRITNPRRKRLLHNPWALLVVWVTLFIGIALIVRQGQFFQPNVAQLAIGMALGGACGNITDQFRHGAVTDFIDLGWWPVFNLGDAAITIGVILALWFLR